MNESKNSSSRSSSSSSSSSSDSSNDSNVDINCNKKTIQNEEEEDSAINKNRKDSINKNVCHDNNDNDDRNDKNVSMETKEIGGLGKSRNSNVIVTNIHRTSSSSSCSSSSSSSSSNSNSNHNQNNSSSSTTDPNTIPKNLPSNINTNGMNSNSTSGKEGSINKVPKNSVRTKDEFHENSVVRKTTSNLTKTTTTTTATTFATLVSSPSVTATPPPKTTTTNTTTTNTTTTSSFANRASTTLRGSMMWSSLMALGGTSKRKLMDNNSLLPTTETTIPTKNRRTNINHPITKNHNPEDITDTSQQQQQQKRMRRRRQPPPHQRQGRGRSNTNNNNTTTTNHRSSNPRNRNTDPKLQKHYSSDGSATVTTASTSAVGATASITNAVTDSVSTLLAMRLEELLILELNKDGSKRYMSLSTRALYQHVISAITNRPSPSSLNDCNTNNNSPNANNIHNINSTNPLNYNYSTNTTINNVAKYNRRGSVDYLGPIYENNSSNNNNNSSNYNNNSNNSNHKRYVSTEYFNRSNNSIGNNGNNSISNCSNRTRENRHGSMENVSLMYNHVPNHHPNNNSTNYSSATTTNNNNRSNSQHKRHELADSSMEQQLQGESAQTAIPSTPKPPSTSLNSTTSQSLTHSLRMGYHLDEVLQQFTTKLSQPTQEQHGEQKLSQAKASTTSMAISDRLSCTESEARDPAFKNPSVNKHTNVETYENNPSRGMEHTHPTNKSSIACDDPPPNFIRRTNRKGSMGSVNSGSSNYTQSQSYLHQHQQHEKNQMYQYQPQSKPSFFHGTSAVGLTTAGYSPNTMMMMLMPSMTMQTNTMPTATMPAATMPGYPMMHHHSMESPPPMPFSTRTFSRRMSASSSATATLPSVSTAPGVVNKRSRRASLGLNPQQPPLPHTHSNSNNNFYPYANYQQPSNGAHNNGGPAQPPACPPQYDPNQSQNHHHPFPPQPYPNSYPYWYPPHPEQYGYFGGMLHGFHHPMHQPINNNVTYRERLGSYLHPRDMRKLVTPFSSTSTNNEPELIVRRHVILLNYDPLRAIILRDRILVIVPDGADSILHQLEKRIRIVGEVLDDVENNVFGTSTTAASTIMPTSPPQPPILNSNHNTNSYHLQTSAHPISVLGDKNCNSDNVDSKIEPFITADTPRPVRRGSDATAKIHNGVTELPTTDINDSLDKITVPCEKGNSKSNDNKDNNADEDDDTENNDDNNDDDEMDNGDFDDEDLCDDDADEDDDYNDYEDDALYDETEFDELESREWIELPFELQCVDAVLFVVTSILSDETKRLERKASAVLDGMMSLSKNSKNAGLSINDDPLSVIRTIKDSTREMTSRVKAFVESMNRILDEDKLMALMNLSRLLTHPERFIQPVPNEVLDEESDEPELLLETNLQIGLTLLNSLDLIQGKIEAASQMIDQRLGAMRNRILYADMLMSVATLGVAFASMIGSMFGMNLYNSIEENPIAFRAVVITTIIGSFLLMILIFVGLVLSGTIPRPSMINKVIGAEWKK